MYRSFLSSAICAAALLTLTARPALGAVVLNGISNLGKSSGNYTNASSIPVSNADLINGLLPSSSDYVGNFETAGGSPAPFTNGSTGIGLSDTTNTSNALFGIPAQWQVTYSLGGSFNLTSIVVTTGHQDSRLNQHYDIFTSLDGTLFTSLSGGLGFVFTPSQGVGGAAQTTLTENTTGILASGVTALRFQALDSGNDVFRELDVFGTAIPEPASAGLLGLGLVFAAWRRRA